METTGENLGKFDVASARQSLSRQRRRHSDVGYGDNYVYLPFFYQQRRHCL